MEVQINPKTGHFELIAMSSPHSIDNFNKHDASFLKKTVLQSDAYIMQLGLIRHFIVQHDSISCNPCVDTVKE